MGVYKFDCADCGRLIEIHDQNAVHVEPQWCSRCDPEFDAPENYYTRKPAERAEAVELKAAYIEYHKDAINQPMDLGDFERFLWPQLRKQRG